MVVANHQSWADIFIFKKSLIVMRHFLNFSQARINFMCLIMGLCWSALDYPFMKDIAKSF